MGLDLLCVGLTTLDILGRPIDAIPADEAGRLIEGIEIVPAGTAGGTALVAARLGLKVGLASALGDDNAGRFVRATFTEAGVDLALTPTLAGQRTSATILPIDSAGRRPTFHALGASMLTEIGEAHYSALSSVRYVHYAGIGSPRLDRGTGEAFLRAAKEAGCVVTCDLISPGPRAGEELERLLPWIDYFLPSLAEGSFLTGERDAARVAEALRALGAAVCVLKCGADGVLIADSDGVTPVPAFDISVLDTTSCGDSWCAGFIAALARGWAFLDSVRFGAATAALVAQGLGTLGRLETFDATEAALRTMREQGKTGPHSRKEIC
jgi:sugar/nucleoside kinase (ribokinase family)